MVTNAIEPVDEEMQQIATELRQPQRLAIEMLLMGWSDLEIAKQLHVRRETIWRWRHRDSAFRAAL